MQRLSCGRRGRKGCAQTKQVVALLWLSLPDQLTTVVEGNVAAQIVAEVDLARARDLLLRVEQHFFPLRDPSRRARNRKEHGKHRHGKTHRLVDEARVKVDVRVE